MQKHVTTFRKKQKKIYEKGGGYKNIHVVIQGGVIEMSTFVYEGGRGDQKSPKNCPRGLCMPPKCMGQIMYLQVNCGMKVNLLKRCLGSCLFFLKFTTFIIIIDFIHDSALISQVCQHSKFNKVKNSNVIFTRTF